MIFFLCICVWVCSYAQKADSLTTLLQQTKTDSARTLLLSLLADDLTRSDPQKAFETARAGVALAKRIGYEKGLFENYFSLAAAFQGQALFDSAIVYFHKAHSIALRRRDVNGQSEVCSGLGHSYMRKFQMDSSRFYLDKGLALAKGVSNHRVEAGIYNNYGNVFLEESNFQKALDYFVKAAKLYENPVADDYGQCIALSNIGNIEYRLENYSRALDYARQSMAIAKRRSFTSSIGYAHKLLGRIYRKLKNYDSALGEYQRGQKLYTTLGDSRSAAELLQNIGNIYFDKGQYQDALRNYQESLKRCRNASAKMPMAYAYSSIGQALMALKKNDAALRYLDSCGMLAQPLGNTYLLIDNYDAISSVYEAKADYKKALAIHRQLVLLKDSVIQTENRQLAEETQAKYELEKKEARIALLEKDKELKNLQLERHRAIQAGIAIALVLVLIIAVLLINRYRVSNRLKRQAEIEMVRNTIARDLHDDIGSTLSTINIISKLAMRENPNGNSGHLVHIAEQSSRMMESMTDMVWSINPVNDSMEKAVVKMKVFAGEILEPKNINYRFTGEELLKGLILDPEKRKNLFLIYKEAVNNAAKYSDATEVSVSLNHTDGKFVMTVCDNGIGFDEKNVKNGNGLKNMVARANAMGGELRLRSTTGKGTSVTLEMDIT